MNESNQHFIYMVMTHTRCMVAVTMATLEKIEGPVGSRCLFMYCMCIYIYRTNVNSIVQYRAFMALPPAQK